MVHGLFSNWLLKIKLRHEVLVNLFQSRLSQIPWESGTGVEAEVQRVKSLAHDLAQSGSQV